MKREKRPYIVLSFATTDAAMAMEQYCMQHDIPGRHIPLPGQIAAGCGIAWRMKPEEYTCYRQPLSEAAIPVEQITEVWLY